MICAGLGDRERAIQHLQTALKDRSRELMRLKVEPIWDPLRDDPRFVEMLTKVGLAE